MCVDVCPPHPPECRPREAFKARTDPYTARTIMWGDVRTVVAGERCAYASKVNAPALTVYVRSRESCADPNVNASFTT